MGVSMVSECLPSVTCFQQCADGCTRPCECSQKCSMGEAVVAGFWFASVLHMVQEAWKTKLVGVFFWGGWLCVRCGEIISGSWTAPGLLRGACTGVPPGQGVAAME